ncbi:serine hydrolase domain-containing protein [Lachnoclostridium phytofermentans]|nr:serine hydrolase domain-containing protein [Lachnoclostridium phytofermentans]
MHHLISHTSGLHNNYSFDDDLFIGDDRKVYSQIEFFHKYILRQPVETPGSRFNYNNSNYNLLAWIIENVTGMSYEEFLKENIFKPLSMNNTEVDDGIRVLVNKADNYSRDYDKWVKAPYYNEKFSIGAGAIISTCEDLYKWFCCLRDKKLISEKKYDWYFQENLNTYCYGLQHSTVYGTDKYWHGGDHMGIQTYIQNFFDENLCIIILSNNESLNQYKFGDSISDMLHNIDKKIPEKLVEIPISAEDKIKYCGTYLEGKIKVEEINGKLYFTRFKGNLYIEIYHVGNGRFARRYQEQINPYVLAEGDDGIPQFFGYRKVSSQE